MAVIDIFTRKLYVYLLKNKTQDNILEVLNKFFDEHKPEIIMSDNESGFKSRAVQKLMEENETDNIMVEPNDHKALGVIDRAIQNIKNTIYKYMKEENTTSYIKELPKIIKAYNDTPNSGILNIAPNEADEKDNKDKLQILNHKYDLENRKNRIKFNVGDTVRIQTNRKSFVRSYDEKYSDKQYTILEINKTSAKLDNGEDYNLRRLIKTDKVDIPERKNEALTQAKKEAKVERIIKQSGVDTSNIIEGKRTRKPIIRN